MRQPTFFRKVLRRFWRMLLGRVLRRVLRRCLGLGFAAKKVSQKDSLKGDESRTTL